MSHSAWVLLVEDEPEVREILRDLLESEGFLVVTAAHGGEALEELRRATIAPLAILLDLRMPIMNGWEFRKAQLKDDVLALIPVIVMTAERLDLQALKAFADSSVLRKPFELS